MTIQYIAGFRFVSQIRLGFCIDIRRVGKRDVITSSRNFDMKSRDHAQRSATSDSLQ
jgi:hypothetical protein